MSILIVGSSSYIATESCEHLQAASSIDKMISNEIFSPRETFKNGHSLSDTVAVTLRDFVVVTKK